MLQKYIKLEKNVTKCNLDLFSKFKTQDDLLAIYQLLFKIKNVIENNITKNEIIVLKSFRMWINFMKKYQSYKILKLNKIEKQIFIYMCM